MANIVIKNLDNAEDNAMLCALRSRSSSPITVHLNKVAEVGSGKFMASHYINYSHDSIGDCGFTTVHLDNISILAAKAIEESALFNGQECSSRYLDFTNRTPYINHPVINTWLEFYSESKNRLVEHLISENPNDGSVEEKVYLKAIDAKAFDILRSFLPAAVTTNISWVTSIRHLRDQIKLFRFHPLKEMNEIADQLDKLALKEFPNSFTEFKVSDAEAGYYAELSKYWYCDNIYSDDFNASSNIDPTYIDYDVLNKRLKGMPVPKLFKYIGEIRVEFNIDYGSFRDIQRHRSCIIYQPLLTAKLGFNQWYLQQLPADLYEKANTLIANQIEEIAILSQTINSSELQYYIPLGMNVSVPMLCDLNSLIYLLELRSSKYVHPTLRIVIFKLIEFIREKFPELKLNIDESDLDTMTFKRGLQDIVSK